MAKWRKRRGDKARDAAPHRSKGLLPWNYEDIADTEFPGKGALEQVFDLR